MLKRWLTLFLCACLSLQGASLAVAAEVPCPMQAEMEALALAGELDPADMAGCCNDMQTWAETGQLCKTGLDFQGLMVWAPAPAAWVVSLALTANPPGASNTALPIAPPGALWRPPTAR